MIRVQCLCRLPGQAEGSCAAVGQVVDKVEVVLEVINNLVSNLLKGHALMVTNANFPMKITSSPSNPINQKEEKRNHAKMEINVRCTNKESATTDIINQKEEQEQAKPSLKQTVSAKIGSMDSARA